MTRIAAVVAAIALAFTMSCAKDDNKDSKNKRVANKPGDKAPADNKPDDKKPADKTPADKKPADKKPADKSDDNKADVKTPKSRPMAAVPKQGNAYWAVYLAVGKPQAASLKQAAAAARKIGYTSTFPGDINCTRPVDKGAPAPKGDAQAVVIYFNSKTDATTAAKLFGKVAWVGKAKAYCLD